MGGRGPPSIVLIHINSKSRNAGGAATPLQSKEPLKTGLTLSDFHLINSIAGLVN